MDSTTQQNAEVVVRALKSIYPTLMVQWHQITPDAAVFTAKLIQKVDAGARASASLYGAVGVRSWASIGLAAIKVIANYIDTDTFKSNLISIRFIASQHERNLQMHLQDPQTFPCPDFAN